MKKRELITNIALGVVVSVAVVAALLAFKPRGSLYKIRILYEVVTCDESSYAPDDRTASCSELGSWCEVIKSTAMTPYACKQTGRRYNTLHECGKAVVMTMATAKEGLVTCFKVEETYQDNSAQP